MNHCTVEKPPLCIGVDGCSGGWMAVILDGEDFDVEMFSSIQSLCLRYPEAPAIFVDMPIGLWEAPEHFRPDSLLRKNLPKKASSVFSTPCRQAVYAESYEEAKEINKRILGVSLSKQSYYISPKIREIDQFLAENPRWKNRLVEAHPEFSFALLNDRKPVLLSKQTQEGAEARLEILQRCYSKSRDVLALFREKHPKKSRMSDDVLDALVLAVTQALGAKHGFLTLPDTPEKDPRGILMQIVGANIAAEIGVPLGGGAAAGSGVAEKTDIAARIDAGSVKNH